MPSAKQGKIGGVDLETDDDDIDSEQLTIGGGRATVAESKSLASAKPSQRENAADKVEDELNNEDLIKLQEIFEEADEDGGGLDIDEFRSAMKMIMGSQVDDRQLGIIFMKVDANCDESVDWDEYLSFLLMEYQEKYTMSNLFKEMTPFPNALKEIYSNHRDLIPCIKYYPHITHSHGSTVDESDHAVGGRIITLSKDGTANFWTSDMNHIRTEHLLPPKERIKPMWVTDMAVMANINMLAISSTERDISFYDINASKFDKVYQVSGLKACILCLDYWYDRSNMNNAVLVFGDAMGTVSAIMFSEALSPTLFGAQNAKGIGSRRVPFPQLLKGTIKGVKAVKFPELHEDWVRQVKYIPNLLSIISCSSTDETSLFLGDISKKNEGSYFKIRKGIICFDYSKEWDSIVTGGMDRSIRFWNPYLPSKPTAVLKGHSAAVIHLLLGSQGRLIISVGKDNGIKVWDMAHQTCLQSIAPRHVTMGPHILSTVFYNEYTKTLLLSTNQLAALESKVQGQDDAAEKEPTSHNKPVVCALYNNLFNQVVTGCYESVVAVWDIDNGTKTIQFSGAHKCYEKGVVKPVEITAMIFDPTKRRLITGGRDGTVKVWNFNNGACLRELDIFDDYEITGIVTPGDKIITSGWNRRITSYLDSDDDEDTKLWAIEHKDDILSLASGQNSMVAAASYDGDITVWSYETGTLVCRLNAHEGVAPVMGRLASHNFTPAAVKPQVPSKAATSSKASSAASSRQSKQPTQRTAASSAYSEEHSSASHYGGSGTETRNPSRPRSEVSIKEKLEKANEKWEAASDGSKWKLENRDDFYKIHAESYEEYHRKHENTVDKILFLETRTPHRETATLVASGAEGWVRFWSLDRKDGGLKGQFNAAQKAGEGVMSLATDPNNEVLITADTYGYIKVWDIRKYCIKVDVQERRGSAASILNSYNFPFLNTDEGQELKKMPRIRPLHTNPLPQTDPDHTLKEPPLLNSFRAHLSPITDLEYCDGKNYIISTSTDCSARLWTLCGRYIGTFGQMGGWKKLDETMKPSSLPRKLPGDIRRVASAITLQVLKGGVLPKWRLLKNIIMVVAMQARLMGGGMGGAFGGLENLLRQKIGDNNFLSADLEFEEDDEKLLEDVITSSAVLGKAYKPKKRQTKKIPQFPGIKQGSQVSVFSSLPFTDLEPIPEAKVPAVLAEQPEDSLFNILDETLGHNKEKRESKPEAAKKRNRIQDVVKKFKSKIAAGEISGQTKDDK